MASFPALHALLSRCLPQLSAFTLTEVSPTSTFDFATMGTPLVAACTLKSTQSLDFFFLASASPELCTLPEKEVGERFKFLFGKPTLKATLEVAGKRNLAQSSGDWKKAKVILTFTGPGTATAWCIMPNATFQRLLLGLGLRWSVESRVEPQAPAFPQALGRIEATLAVSRNLLFCDVVEQAQRLDTRSYEELITQLLASELVGPAHLASLILYHGTHQRVLDSVSESNAVEIARYKSSLATRLAAEPLRSRWQGQLEYYLHHVIAELALGDGRAPAGLRPWVLANAPVAADMREVRVRAAERFSPVAGLLEELVHNRTVNRVISRECRARVIRVAAADQGLVLDGLYALFGARFREDVEFEIGREKSRLQALEGVSRRREVAEARFELIGMLGAEIEGRLNYAENPFDLPKIHERLAGMRPEALIRLYHVLGFENLAELFELLRDHVTSPLSDRAADEFCRERVDLLPATEGSIVRDIFDEAMNCNRVRAVGNDNRALTRLTNKCWYLSRIGYF